MILRSADATAVCNFPPQVCVDIVPFSSHSVSVGGHGTGPVPLRLLRRCSELNSRIATAVNCYTQLRPGGLLAALLAACMISPVNQCCHSGNFVFPLVMQPKCR